MSVMMGADVEFVEVTFLYAREKALPDSRSAPRIERVGVRVPSVKTADDRHLPGIRRPHAEAHTLLVPGASNVSSQLVVDAVVPPFIEKIEIFSG
jgi:hypothetical protein